MMEYDEDEELESEGVKQDEEYYEDICINCGDEYIFCRCLDGV